MLSVMVIIKSDAVRRRCSVWWPACLCASDEADKRLLLLMQLKLTVAEYMSAVSSRPAPASVTSAHTS